MKKKKKEENILNSFNADWTKDFEFLNFIMQRKKNITKNFLIDVVVTQKEKDTYIVDAEIESIIAKSVTETISMVNGIYKKFLIEKYFGNEENYISFIVEDFYVDLTGYAINKNNEKIRKVMVERTMKQISSLNKKKPDLE